MRRSARLHIVHALHSATFAGVERYVVTTAHELARRGHTVTVIAGPHVRDALAAEARADALTYVEASSVASLARQLAALSRPVDVVHAHMTAAEAAAVVTKAVVRAPIVSTRHFAARRGSSIGARIAGRAIRGGIDRQISISRFVADAIGEPSVVVTNAVPDHAAVDPIHPIVLVTQRLDDEKRTVEAIEAWRRSGLAADGWRMRIAGDGHQRGVLETMVRRRQIDGVELLGRREDVDDLREGCGIVLATAPREPFGLAVAEAMAAGLPVVAARGGAHVETVGAARPDLLYPAGDVDACAATLRRLAHDVELRRRAGHDLREHQRRHLRIDAHVDRLESVYRSVHRSARHERRQPQHREDHLHVLRVCHSGVVTSWRERERRLRERDCDVTLVTARRWNEGGHDVALEPGADEFVVAARTWGRHPYAFVYDPRPIVRELRRRPLELVDVHEEPASLAALEIRALLRLLRVRAPIVYYGAQNIEKRYPQPFRWIERRSLRDAAGAHCCNRAAADIFVRKGLRGVTAVIGLGVDLDRFRPAPPRDDTVLRLGYVGRLERHKGVHVLLDAVAGLEGVVLDVFGEGTHRDALQQQIDRLGLRGRVRLRGFVHDDELPDVYRSLDVLAVPSLQTPDWVEQFGRVAVEAMASGVPVVASDTGALPEVVGDAGVLVAADDADAWRCALAALVADPARRRELREAGLVRATRYSWASVADAHRAFYEHALGDHAPEGGERAGT